MIRPLLLALVLLSGIPAGAALKIVATTSDLAALAAAVAGDKAEVSAIAKGTQDPHQIEAKPSFMVKVRAADLVVAQGLDLESAWIGLLIQGSRNPKIAMGTPGYLELGPKLNPIEIPKGEVSRAEGDVHPGGNPHFQLDPLRVGEAAVLLAERLGELDRANRDSFKKNAVTLQKRLQEKTKEWKSRLIKTGLKEVVTYHKTFNYFLDRFGIANPIQLEPRAGIPPTAAHLMKVVDLMKSHKIKLVLIENYFDEKAGTKVKNEVSGARVISVPVSVEGDPKLKTNEDVIENLVQQIESGSH